MGNNEPGADCNAQDWCGIDWTRWFPFSLESTRTGAIPDAPGIYRIRAADAPNLMYIGRTDTSLRNVFNGIRQSTARMQMPWVDPYPVAPALWAWKDAKGFSYEFSAVPMEDSATQRKTGLCYLLYRYRQEKRDSPACNFGRFHRKYRCSSAEGEGIAGGPLAPQDPKNPAGGPATSPLAPAGSPGDANWMGLTWSPKRELLAHTTTAVPQAQGVYLLFDGGAGPLLAVRTAENCSQALFELSKNPPEGRTLAFMVCCEAKPVAGHNLRERQCDLAGHFIELNLEAPALQFWEEYSG